MSTALSMYLAIAPQSPEEGVLRLLIELAAQFVDGDEGSILVVDEKTDELVFAMVANNDESKLIGKRIPLGKGLTGLAAATREVQIGAPTYVVGQESKGGDGPQAVLAAPMLVGDEVVGVITAVSFRESKRFGIKDAQLYARIASVAGVVVQQRRTLNKLAEALEEERADNTPETSLERKVFDSIGRIAKSSPKALEHVAALLATVEALSAPSLVKERPFDAP